MDEKVEALPVCELKEDAAISLSQDAQLEVGRLNDSLLEWFGKVSLKIVEFLHKKYHGKGGDKDRIRVDLDELHRASDLLTQEGPVDFEKFTKIVDLNTVLVEEIEEIQESIGFCGTLSKKFEPINASQVEKIVSCLKSISHELASRLKDMEVEE